MGKVLLVSNRLSTSVSITPGGLEFSPSMGGLATGLSSLHEQKESLWVGWSGIPSDSISEQTGRTISERLLNEHKSVSVPLSTDEIEDFYYGFCNNIIWPLFHYFPTYAEYENRLWDRYRAVNEKFAQIVLDVAEEDDFIWVHDYQLMLLPQLLKKKLPRSRIGFFLHIPFPSYEIFRLLPWREEILEGLLGSDLVGFHTYDYARHFLSAVRRITGVEHQMANVNHHNRIIKVDAFPMGIDYEKYRDARQQLSVQREIEAIRAEVGDRKIILSVDRLDYSKGIPMRIRAYSRFLDEHPEYRQNVTLILIVAPSRTEVSHYKQLKREIEELVSITNGLFGTIAWTPILYFYRPFPFDQLTATYTQSDVLLVTPLRDGMNLIAKEYIAARSDMLGAIVLSETAGAARELGEAITINPNNEQEIANAILQALEMPEAEQLENNRSMHERLARYDIHYWATDFMDKLVAVSNLQESFRQRVLTTGQRKSLVADFCDGQRRLIFIDYDGTLLNPDSRSGRLDERNMQSIATLVEDPRNEVVVISGRPKEKLQQVFGDLPVGIIAAHGVWYKGTSDHWHLTEQVTSEWIGIVLPILELYRDRTPGTRVEVSDFSLVWNYRKSQPELAAVRLSELKDAIMSITANHDLSIMERNYLLEIKNSAVSKGRAAKSWYQGGEWDFVMAIGDDWTDEDMFTMLRPQDYSIKVGIDLSHARYFVESPEEVRELLELLADTCRTRTGVT